MPVVTSITEAIDRAVEADEKGERPHLGASQVGKPCLRALVYGFRHATKKKTQGRMLRLFSRGHREEPDIIALLRRIGFEVQEVAERLTIHLGTDSYAAVPWDRDEGDGHDGPMRDVTGDDHHVKCAAEVGIKLKQWAFHDIGGHHSGSTDGKAVNPPDNLFQVPELPPGEWFALEFKTYNVKSFGLLVAQGMRALKPEHYSQVQEYMHYMELKRCLYIAVCKDNDQLYMEVVEYDEHAATGAIEKARAAISARQLPRRFSENSTNMTCKFCDHRAVCHFGDPLQKSCRTCTHVSAVTEGTGARWHCGLWNSLIPVDEVKVGCDSWSPITD